MLDMVRGSEILEISQYKLVSRRAISILLSTEGRGFRNEESSIIRFLHTGRELLEVYRDHFTDFPDSIVTIVSANEH